MIPYSARSFYANLPEIRNIPEVISHLILKLDRVYRSVSEIKVVTYMYTYMSQVTCKHYIVQNTWCWWDFLQFINSIIIWYFKWPLFYTSIDLRGIWLQFISSGAGHILYIMMNNCLQCFITFMNKGACSYTWNTKYGHFLFWQFNLNSIHPLWKANLFRPYKGCVYLKWNLLVRQVHLKMDPFFLENGQFLHPKVWDGRPV